MFLVIALVLTLAWGALAFGAVYPWAYVTLGICCFVVAVCALLRRMPRHHSESYGGGPGSGRWYGLNVPLLAGLLLVAAVVGIQLVPLSHERLIAISPATDEFRRKSDLQYQALLATLRLADTDADARSGQGGARGAGAGGGAEAGRAGAYPISIDPARTQIGLGLFGVFALLLLALTRGLTARDARKLAPVLVGLGVVLALVGIIQKATYAGKIYGFWEPFASGAGPFGPFVNRNHYAGWMLMALPLGLGYFMALVSRGMGGGARGARAGGGAGGANMDRVWAEWQARILWFASADANRVVLVAVGLLVMGLALVMTMSRSGITCFTIALLISGFVAIRRQGKRSKRALAGSYIALAFVLAIGWAGIDTIAARFEAASKDYQYRLAIWSDALAVHHDFPMLGCGLNAFGAAMTIYQTAELGDTHAGEAHNDYVQILAEGGIALSGAALVLLVIFIVQVRRRFRHDTDDEMTYWLRVGAVTGLVAIALQSIGEFSLQMPGNAAMFVTLMAIAAGRLPHRGRGHERGTSEVRRPRSEVNLPA